MILKLYKNEFILAITFVFMLSGIIYKSHQVSKQAERLSHEKNTLHEIKEIIALKNVWMDKKIHKKVENLRSLVAPSKINWHQRNRKVTARFSTLSALELNRLLSRLLTLSVEIQSLRIDKTGPSYTMEFKCRW
jgi:hypothetical protein